MSSTMSLSRNNLREYNRIHKWVGRHYTKSGICEFCFKVCKTQWSNKSNKYMQDRIDWQELCQACHYRYDTIVMKVPRLPRKDSDPHSENSKISLKRYFRKELAGYDWGDKQSVETRLRSYPWFDATP